MITQYIKNNIKLIITFINQLLYQLGGSHFIIVNLDFNFKNFFIKRVLDLINNCIKVES